MYYENGSFKIYYEKYGTGDNNILILPGWGDTRPTFKYLINNLAIDNNVYIIDIPGFGNSIVKEEDLSIYDYASCIREIIQHEKIDNPIIIAHSFGGRIATLLSGYYNDEIKKMVFIDVAGVKPKMNIYKVVKKYTYKFLKKISILLPKEKRDKFKKYLFKKYSSTDYYNLPENMKKTFQNIVNTDLTQYISSIKSETLILWGEYDEATPLKDAYKFRKKIKDSALIILKKANHFSYLNYPYLTIDIINKFINEKK